MDEVWIVSLCLMLFACIVFLISSKSKSEPKVKEEETTASAPVGSSYGGKHLECTEEDMERMMEKLTKVIYEAGAKMEPQCEQRRVFSQDRAETQYQHRGSEKMLETRDPPGEGPGHSQAAYHQSPHKERPSHLGGIENIMDEIEQAVQETVESDLYMRRRQHPVARGHHEGQWSERNVEHEAENL